MKTELYESMQSVAQHCRDTRIEGTFLCDPLDGVDVLGESSQFSPLLLCHNFDPLGPPDVMSLILIDVPKSDECLLVQRIIMPLDSHARVYGLIPNQIALDRTALSNVISTLFNRNGSDEMPIFRERPTAVHVAADGLLFKEPEQRELYRLAINILGAKGLSSEIDHYRLYYSDPWARAEARLYASMPEFFLVVDELVPDEECEEEVSSSQFGAWWGLVTDPVHVEREADALRLAWKNLLEVYDSVRDEESRAFRVSFERQAYI